MKRLIGGAVSHTLFWLGDMVSRPMQWFEFCCHLYPIYSWLMQTSDDVQNWGGVGPWRHITDEDL